MNKTKNTPKPTPYASDAELAKIQAQRLDTGPGAFDRFKQVAQSVVAVAKPEFEAEWEKKKARMKADAKVAIIERAEDVLPAIMGT